MSVLVIGGTGIDTLVPVPKLPVPEVEVVLSTPIRDFVAHTGTGVALALRALNVPVTVVDALGDDPPGRLVREAFAEWRLPLRVAVNPGGTVRAVNLMSPDGQRLSCYDPRPMPGFRLPRELYLPVPPGVRHVHVSIMDWARHVLADLRADPGTANVKISTDLHDWDGGSHHHRDFAYGADMVFLSASALAEPDRAAADVLTHGRAEVVVVTAGARGATLYRQGRAPHHEPAVDPGEPIVNTNGAGDALVAAYVAADLAGLPPEAALRRGVVAGAFACTRDVGPDGFITPDRLP